MQRHTDDPKVERENPGAEEVTLKQDEIGSDERVCCNCKHLLWGIALGIGLRCTEPRNYDRSSGNMPPMVPSRRHTCDGFEFSHPPSKD